MQWRVLSIAQEYADEELNEMLARSDEDLRIFAQIDKERRERQTAAWRASGRKGEPPRLMSMDEIPKEWLEKAIPREVRMQLEFESHGRGQRKQSVRGRTLGTDGCC